MHDISSDRFQGAADLTALGSVFDSQLAPPQLLIVTSKWRNLHAAEAERRHRILANRLGPRQLHEFRDEKADAWKIVKNFLPQIEVGAMLDFGRAFNDLKAKKTEKEVQYEKERNSFMRRFTRSILRIFGIGKPRRKGKGA